MKKVFFSSKILLLLILMVISIKVKANYMAGEIGWTCVGQDSFLIEAKLYRDCNEAIFDQINLAVHFVKSGQLADKLTMTLVGVKDVTPTCSPLACTRCKNPACSFPYGFEECTYTALLILKALPTQCEVVLSINGLRYNKSITTIETDQFTYLETKLNLCANTATNSPDFINVPVGTICIGHNAGIDLSCHNLEDYDSISYSISTINSATGSSIEYKKDFSYDKPFYFWGFPNQGLSFPRGFHLNSAAANLNFKPMKIESSVFAIRMSLWKEKTRVGQIKRQYQYIIISCPNNNAPVLSGPFYKEVCGGDSVQFSILSNDYDTRDTLRLQLNCTIPGVVWQDNNNMVKHPTGIFTWKTSTADISDVPYYFSVLVKDDARPVPALFSRSYQIMVKDCSTSYMEENVDQEFLVYPIPTKSRLTIQSAQMNGLISAIEIFNYSGKRCFEMKDVMEEVITIDLDELQNGNYILKITDIKGPSFIDLIQVFK